MGTILYIASQLDPKVMVGIAIVLIILLILSLIKKMIKLAIFIAIATIIVGVATPYVSSFQEEYNIKLQGKAIVATIDGKEVEISKDNCSKIEIRHIYDYNTDGISTNTLYIYMDGSPITMEIPEILNGAIEKMSDSIGIEYEYKSDVKSN